MYIGNCIINCKLYYSQKDYYNVEDAKKSIKRNEIWALIRFNWNYTESLKNRVSAGRDSTDDVIDHSFLEYWVDDSGDLIFFKEIK